MTQALELLNKGDTMQSILRVLPDHIDRKRFEGLCISVAKNRMLLSNIREPASLLFALYGCARLGLTPNDELGQAYIVPYKGAAQLQIGYQGYIHLARRSGGTAIHAEVIYQNDEFDELLGTERKLHHRAYDVIGLPEPGEIIGAYVTWMERGNPLPQFHRIGADRLARAREASQTASKSFSPWKSDPAAMSRKTAVRDAKHKLPLSPDLLTAIQFDEEAERGASQSAYREDFRRDVEVIDNGGDSLPANVAMGFEEEPATSEPEYDQAVKDLANEKNITLEEAQEQLATS